MDFGLTNDQQAIVDGVTATIGRFGDDYWLERDREGSFPHEFYQTVADGGWLGIAMPEEFGGAGLGVTEAALMMAAIAGSGGAMAAASSDPAPGWSEADSEWPDDDVFSLPRWQRPEPTRQPAPDPLNSAPPRRQPSNQRPLPRSSRRRSQG